MSIGKQQNTAGLRRFCAAVHYGGAEAHGPETGKKQDPGGEAGHLKSRGLH